MSGKPKSDTANPFAGLSKEELIAALTKVEEGRKTTPANAVAPEVKEEDVPTCWEAFTTTAYHALCCCLKASEKLIDGAIDIGSDAASAALKDSIDSSTLTADQKSALKHLSEAALRRIVDRLEKGLDKAVEESEIEGDPRLVAAIEAGIKLGLLDSFVPKLGEAVREAEEDAAAAASTAASKEDSVPSSKQIVKVTTSKLWAKLSSHVLKNDTSDIVHLGATKDMLVINPKQLKRIVEDAVRDSGMPESDQKTLISTGAVESFFEAAIAARNKKIDDSAKAADEAIHSKFVASLDSMATAADTKEGSDALDATTVDASVIGDAKDDAVDATA